MSKHKPNLNKSFSISDNPNTFIIFLKGWVALKSIKRVLQKFYKIV